MNYKSPNQGCRVCQIHKDEKSVVHGKVSSEQFEGVIHTVG